MDQARFSLHPGLGSSRYSTVLRARTLRTFAIALALAFVATLVAPATAANALTPAPRVLVGEVTPGELVELTYKDLLGRSADAGGREYWSTAIASGLPISDVIESMLASREVGGAYDPTIRLYSSAFLRPPDYQGLSYWVRTSRSGVPMETIASSFAASGEFERRYGSLNNQQFVRQVYQNVLGRDADQGGLDYWSGALLQGASRGTVLLAFSESPENIRKTSVSTRMSLLTATLLRRVPNQAEVTNWRRQSHLTTTGTLINRVLNSTNYQNRLASLFPVRNRLTGQATAAVPTRPALAVKIDNVDKARNHTGLGMADIVYEEMVEGNLSRLIAVYHSQSPATVGPVRSIRTSDFDILAPFNQPLLAASGANPGVLNALTSAPVVNVNAIVAGSSYRRERSRRAPHNLYTDPAHLWTRAPAGATAPPVMLNTGTNHSSGIGTGGIGIEFGRASIGWTWDRGQKVWRRSQNGSAFIDNYGLQIGAENVVVMITPYTPSVIDANSPEAHTVGTGRALVFTKGTFVDGTWSRSSASEPINYFDSAGNPIVLRPGQTWIELAPINSIALKPNS